MEPQGNLKNKEVLVAPVKPEVKKRWGGCLWGIFGVFVGVVIFPFLLVAVGVLAISATGIVKVPVLSDIFKTPAVAEDFSYKKSSEKQLTEKFGSLGETSGKINVTLTDDEVNSLISSMFSQSGLPVKEILVKFEQGIVALEVILVPNDAPLYARIALNKTVGSFQFEVLTARLGALPVPGVFVEGIVGEIFGTKELLGKPTAEDFPMRELAVKDGKIVIKGLDLSKLMPQHP